MRRIFLNFFYYGLIAVSFLLLSSCSGLSTHFATAISNKNGGSITSGNKNGISAPGNQQCNKWCHNGWCSIHCEDVTN